MHGCVSRGMVGIAAVSALVAVVGCHADRPSRTVRKSIAAGTAQSAEVSIDMSAGELHLNGDAEPLLDAAFTISDEEPRITYAVNGGVGKLSLQESDAGASWGRTNEWTLGLSSRIPMTLRAHLGAGEAKMALGHLDLRKLVVEQGVGELELDLRGSPRHDLDVELHGGVGESRVLLPRTVAITAEATNGIGEIKIDGLQQRGGAWINPGHEGDSVHIHLSVSGGVGEIHISAE